MRRRFLTGRTRVSAGVSARVSGGVLLALAGMILFAHSVAAETQPENEHTRQRWSRFPESSNVYPSPEPFTLNRYDAVQAVWMIRRAALLLYQPPGVPGEIIPIRTVTDVRAVHAGTDPDAPGPQHEARYDITINGEALEWENTFIRYGGRMINLQALFTYRNQEPPPGLRYRLDP